MQTGFSELVAQITICEECYFRNPDIVPLAPAEVAAPVAIMFVGENPSWQDGQHVPFDSTTISGQSLEANYLTPLGLTRDQVWITDLFKCRYPKHVYRAKQQAEPRVQSEVVAACKRWLVEEIVYARPKVVVTLSDSQVYQRLRRAFAFSVPARFDLAAGVAHEVQFDGHSVILFPMVHPDVARPIGQGDNRKKRTREKWAPIHANTHLPALAQVLGRTTSHGGV